MASCPVGVSRITSKDIVITWQLACHPRIDERLATLPVYGTAQNNIVDLSEGTASSGTYKLRVNGYLTGAITVGGLSSAIQTALEALSNVGSGDLLVTGTAPNFVITGAANLLNQFVLIEVEADNSDTGDIAVSYDTVGSAIVDIQGELMSFSWTEDQETTDATGIAEAARVHLPTVRDANFDVGVYEAIQSFYNQIYAGCNGWVTVYEQGRGTGLRYMAFNSLITSFEESMQPFEKVEISISGRRQGDWIIPPGSFQ